MGMGGLRSMRVQELQCVGGACMRVHAMQVHASELERGSETEWSVKPRRMEQASSCEEERWLAPCCTM